MPKLQYAFSHFPSKMLSRLFALVHLPAAAAAFGGAAFGGAATLGGHHDVDPFAGSGCTCETFCDYKCAINATAASNTTFYRMTPHGVLDMSNKDTGDVHGDTSFVLSRRTVAYQCRKDPSSFFCNGLTQVRVVCIVPFDVDCMYF